MGIEYGFGGVSGFSLEDAHFIGTRWDPTVEGAADQLVIRAHSSGYESLISLQSCADLWRSASGAVYAAAGPRIVWTTKGAHEAAPWHTFDCPTVAGIWGLDDANVFALPRGLATDYYFRFDGRAWSRHDAPGTIHRMDGKRSDALVAVGSAGLIAYWEGRSWRVHATETRGVFLDVHVVSDDEMYAVHDSGQLWQGSVYGWTVRHESAAGSLSCVAKWRDRVWVGTSDQGLCVLDGTSLVPVKPNIRPRRMDARRDLLMYQSEMVVATSDGERFRAIQPRTVQTLYQGIAPRWKS